MAVPAVKQSPSGQEHRGAGGGLPGAAEFAQVSRAAMRQELFVATFALVNFFLFKLIVSFEYFSEVRDDLNVLFGFVFIGFSGVLLYFLAPSLWRDVVRQFKVKRLTPEACTLAALMVGTAAVVSSVVLNFSNFVSTLGIESLLVSAALVVLDRALQRSYQGQLEHRARFSPDHLGARVRLVGIQDRKQSEPETRLQLRLADVAERGESWRYASELVVGEVFEVGKGQMIPCDAIVVGGAANILQRKISGRGEPRAVGVGESVFAGSTVTAGTIQCRVSSALEDSLITSFIEPVNEVVEQSEREYRNWSFYTTSYCFLILALASSMGIFWAMRGAAISEVAQVVMGILFVSIAPRVLDVLPVMRAVAIVQALLKGIFLRSHAVLSKLCQIKNLVLDYSEEEAPGVVRVATIELLDRRFDRGALLSVLYSILGRTDREREKAVVAFIAKELGADCPVRSVDDFHDYAAQGVSGVVEGMEFSIGSEGFLIERGVQMQVSEVQGAEDDTLYVAIEDGVVAEVRFAELSVGDGSELVRRSKRLGVRTVLCSQETVQNFDGLGKQIGLELTDVKGDLDRVRYQETLEKLKPCALYYNRAGAQKLAQSVDVSITSFNELKWSLDGGDVTLFGRDLDLLAELLEHARKYFLVRRMAIVSAFVMTPLLLGAAAAGVVGPVTVLACVIMVTMLLQLNSWRLID